MRLSTIMLDGKPQLAICKEAGCASIKNLNNAFNRQWSTSMDRIIETGSLDQLNDWYRHEGSDALDKMSDLFLNERHWTDAPLYLRPPKIWGIGLNYREHAADLSEQSPTSAPAK